MLLSLVTFLVVSSVDSKSIHGVFDNVTVHVKDLETSAEDTIFIDFDDALGKYLSDKPSQIITIQNQFIAKLEPNSIADLPHLRNLTLAKNGIREIQRGTFINLPNLKTLNLSQNAIEEIRNGVFNNLSLSNLYLDNNRIHRIGYKAFSHLHLKTLLLDHNRIPRWSRDWFADSSVRFLDVSFNLIGELPQNSFQLMTKPAALIFSNNQLKKINADVFSGFENYKSIFLDNNSIDRLDLAAFRGVKHINVLNLNNNSISEVSPELFRTTAIDVLMLEDNKLRCLSTDIFIMEELDIDGNPITCFCVKTWLDWRDQHSNPSIYHITNLEQECI